jgi:transcriptional regulator with XRE-family HTH domain
MPILQDPEMNQAFGSNLRRVRLARDLSQDDVDYLLGHVHGHLGHYERGRIAPGLLILIKLAGCLETTIDELVPSDNQRTRPRRVAHPTDLPTLVDRSEFAAVTSECVRRIRSKRKLTRPELASAAGLSENLVDRIEGTGKGPISIPNLVSLVRLSKALSAKPSEIAGGIRYVPDSDRRKNVLRGERIGRQSGRVEGDFVRGSAS